MGLAPPPSSGPWASSARRAQLADFLRARRAEITPAEVGLPVIGRRRTPGLRREEVAQRAGVGLSWYTWLEQSRDITPSAQVLLALSQALRLSPSEQDHLFLLAWMFGGDAGWSEHSDAWRASARANLLDFRTEYARHPDDPAYRELIDELADRSELLRTWWAEHAVQPLEPAHKQIPHATLGELSLLQSQSRLAHQPSLRLRVVVPADDRTRHILAEAASRAA